MVRKSRKLLYFRVWMRRNTLKDSYLFESYFIEKAQKGGNLVFLYQVGN